MRLPIQKKWARVLILGLLVLAGLTVLALTVGATYIGVVHHNIQTRVTQLRATQASKFYASYPPLRVDSRFRPKQLRDYLLEVGLIEKFQKRLLQPGNYLWTQSTNGDVELLLYRPEFFGVGRGLPARLFKLEFDWDRRRKLLELDTITRIQNDTEQEVIKLPPREIGYFYAGRLRTQHAVAFSEVPVVMRTAIMAIEDAQFLEHIGVSVRGTTRAIIKDIIAMKFVQGGSTITQQLMKILFFSKRKVLSRKFFEAIYAFVAEATLEKEAILEAYLNEVYFGQRGSQEIHGVAEAALYYFNRPISKITLAQAASLAALVQRPNYLDPTRHPERHLARRNLVLKKMLEHDFILPREYKRAAASPISVVASGYQLNDSAYFNDLLMESLPENIRERLDTEALSLYLTLDPYLQNAASFSLAENLTRLERTYKTLKDNAESGVPLQGAILAVDIRSCQIVAAQGGRRFEETQFNRILHGKRQPGSLFKPFVYLTAFKQTQNSPTPITPKTLIEDKQFTWNYEAGQSWTPKNYDEEYRGLISAETALMKSINVPTAKLAQRIGIDAIVETIRKAGIRSEIPVVPSVSLGSAEVSPYELAQAFTTIAREGAHCPLQTFTAVFDENGNLILEDEQEEKQTLPVIPTTQVVEILKKVLTRGTGAWVQKTGLHLEDVAGKTGTTNDDKDAWFVGFSPNLLALVWVGYDEEKNVGLPGSLAALPVWVDFIKQGGEPRL